MDANARLSKKSEGKAENTSDHRGPQVIALRIGDVLRVIVSPAIGGLSGIVSHVFPPSAASPAHHQYMYAIPIPARLWHLKLTACAQVNTHQRDSCSSFAWFHPSSEFTVDDAMGLPMGGGLLVRT